MEDLLAVHRKERKQLLNQCTQLKKQAQSDKKKKQELLAQIQRLEKELDEKQALELNNLQTSLSQFNIQNDESLKNEPIPTNSNCISNSLSNQTLPPGNETNELENITPTPKKLSRQKLRKLRKEKEIEELREKALKEPIVDHQSEELSRFKELLSNFGLCIHPIPANGHCLFNAVSHQLLTNHEEEYSVSALRKLAVEYMRQHPQDFIPFLLNETSGKIVSEEEFLEYCTKMESTAVWGGHLEIQALANALRKCIEVYQVASNQPIIVGDPNHHRLRLSYHLHQYALGQHYNSLVKNK